MLLNKEQLIYFSFRLFFVVIECLFLTYLLCFVLFFFRFGLSNRFDTEFPSVLTGKVQLLFKFFLHFSLADCFLFKSKWEELSN